jgi:hypothetical protein
MEGIQVCSNTGPSPLQRRKIYKDAYIKLGHVKIFSRASEPEKRRFT